MFSEWEILHISFPATPAIGFLSQESRQHSFQRRSKPNRNRVENRFFLQSPTCVLLTVRHEMRQTPYCQRVSSNCMPLQAELTGPGATNWAWLYEIYFQNIIRIFLYHTQRVGNISIVIRLILIHLIVLIIRLILSALEIWF